MTKTKCKPFLHFLIILNLSDLVKKNTVSQCIHSLAASQFPEIRLTDPIFLVLVSKIPVFRKILELWFRELGESDWLVRQTSGNCIRVSLMHS